MSRKPITDIMLRINELLKKERELSVNQIAFKIRSQWRTTEKALEVLKKLEIVLEKTNKESNRKERIFYRV